MRTPPALIALACGAAVATSTGCTIRQHTTGLQQHQHQAEATGPGRRDGGGNDGSGGDGAGTGGGGEGGGGDSSGDDGDGDGGEAESGGRQVQERRFWLGTTGKIAAQSDFDNIVSDAPELRLAGRGPCRRIATSAECTCARCFVEAERRFARPFPANLHPPGKVPFVNHGKRLAEEGERLPSQFARIQPPVEPNTHVPVTPVTAGID